MEQLSRRSFLRKGSTTVAAGALAATGLSKAASAATTGQNEARLQGTTGARRSEPIVVYVPDATKPEVRIMVGDREIVRRDASLVRTVVRESES